MTATTPQPMEGTQAPSHVEYLYERYKHLLKWLLVILVGAFAVYYGMRWQRQGEIDQTWTQFSTTIGLEGSYTSEEGFTALTDLLEDQSIEDIEGLLAAANDGRAPYLLLAIARRAMLASDWDRAEQALDELESKYPDHSLVQASPYPVQVREVKEDENKTDETPSPRNQKPEFKEPVAGSIVGRMRSQIAAAKNFSKPEHFARPEIPADAPRVRFELSGDYGSFVIALMPQAPKHRDKFLELARMNDGDSFWKGLNVDEIQRPGTGMAALSRRPMQFHLGFETTKDPDSTKWTKTDPSEHQLEFEETGLSHFPGAVAARVEADGMSCADRFWVCADDAAQEDGRRVVFGYVVEGLENVEEVCRAAMTAQEEESGIGTPTDNITVESVTVLE